MFVPSESIKDLQTRHDETGAKKLQFANPTSKPLNLEKVNAKTSWERLRNKNTHQRRREKIAKQTLHFEYLKTIQLRGKGISRSTNAGLCWFL